MQSKYLLPFCVMAILFSTAAQSQVYIYPNQPRYYRPHQQRAYRQPQQQATDFKPSVELSLGYGFPNLDKNSLPEYNAAYRTNTEQLGPFAGSLNYKFSPKTSIGILVTHGSVNAPYYVNNSTSAMPAFNAKLNNWAYMLNLINYLPGSKAVSPYTRVAIGVNSWQQNYTDASGNKLAMQPANLPGLAYQLSLGAKFHLSKNTSFFVEAGYGKYIVEGGLAFKL